jgi:hypothetical protein
MEEQVVQFVIDPLLIGRGLVALFWGFAYAVWLQHTRRGQVLAEERTWITVVIGVGVDLALAYGGDWWTVVLVIAASAVGIIGRSLANETKEPYPKGYKMLWSIKDAHAALNDLIVLLEAAVEEATGVLASDLSHALRLTHIASRKVELARKGEYDGREYRPETKGA